jgi:BirA family biotin operon repressor/biotin-[acetyl-CoA-carboxylase] ligase
MIALDPETASAPRQPLDGWRLDVLAATESTNLVAARRPAWHAVRAETQSAGRGRTGRQWVSDAGGLWLSAVLPCPGPRDAWALLPLAAGHALLAALGDLGASGLRLRWPNDILVGRRKLAGLLVERHTPDTAVVGIGLNVHNHPEAAEPGLRDATIRLADLVPLNGLELDAVAAVVLAALARAHHRLETEGFGPIAEELNQAWASPRLVVLTLAGRADAVVGRFLGVDAAGRLLLESRDRRVTAHAPVAVALLHELDD